MNLYTDNQRALQTEKVAPGIRDGLLYLNNIILSLGNRPREMYVDEISQLTNYRDDVLQAQDRETGLYFLYKKSENDTLSTEAYKAVIKDADGNKWIIIGTHTNPYLKEAYLNSYTDIEKSIYHAISPEVFGALGNGNDDTDAFEAMLNYIPCMRSRIIIIRSKYLITRDLRINIPVLFIGSDSISDILDEFNKTKDFNILKKYPYGLVLRDSNIYALCDTSALMVERIPFNNTQMNMPDSYQAYAEGSIGMSILFKDVLMLDEKCVDSESLDKINTVNSLSNFTYDKRYVNIYNLMPIGVTVREVSDLIALSNRM
jgi:hypothetical protein